MIVTGLNHYTIRASTEIIDECVSFYTSILNLRIGFRPPSNNAGFWLYAGEMPLLHLMVTEDPRGPASGHLDHIAFSCVNLPVTIRRLTDLNIDFSTNDIPEIDQYQIFTRDPAGLVIELNFTCEKIEPPPE